MSRPRVLLIYPNHRVPFIFQELVHAEADVTVVHSPAAAFPPVHACVTGTVALDIYGDPGRSAATLADLHAQRRFDCVFPVHEPCVPFASDLARRLGLRGLPAEAALAARDKKRMRDAFRTAGLNAPAFAKVAAGVQDLPPGMRYPVVVKPTSGYSSQGVIRADDDAQLVQAVARVAEINRDALDVLSPAQDGTFAGILVEEYIDGTEYAAECFAQDGTVYIMSLAEKDALTGPYFEERSYIVPARLSGDVLRRTLSEVRRGMLALGITDGAAHVEFRIRDGEPYLIEIGARLGGSGLAHFFVNASAGHRPAKLVLDNLLGGADVSGLPEDPMPTASSACYIIPVGGSGRLVEIAGLDELRDHPATRHILQFLFPGDDVPAWPAFAGYPAFVLSRHAGFAEAEAFHDLIARTVRMRYATEAAATCT